LDSNAWTVSTLDSIRYPSAHLLTRSVTRESKANGIKCVSIDKPPPHPGKTDIFGSKKEKREGRKYRAKSPPNGRGLLAPSSQISILNSNRLTVSTLDSNGYASIGPVDRETKRAIKPMESN
jgi:hypothetical protein